MGGIDNTNITLTILIALSSFSTQHPVDVTVIISPHSPFYQEVIAYVKHNAAKFVQLDFVENMADLIGQHTMAIGAPGGSSWERACLGIPSILIPIADNQKTIGQRLSQCDAAITLSPDAVNEQLGTAILKLIADYERYKKSALSLCDARGVYRAAYHIDALTQDKNQAFYNCRLATKQDVNQVFSWQTMPETRRFSNNTKAPIYPQHVRWMKNALESIDHHFYIIEILAVNNSPLAAGVVRLEKIIADKYLISIFIDPEHYQKDLGVTALAFIDHIHPDYQIHATVLPENLASHKLFAKAGYKKVDELHYLRNINNESKI